MMGHNDNRGWACSLGAMLSGGCRPPASKSCQPDRNFCPADRNFGNCDCFFSLPAVSRGWHSACRGRVSALLACTDVSRCQGYALSARLHYLFRSIGCTRESPCENPSVFSVLSARLHYLSRSIGCTRESPSENPSVFPVLSARLHYLFRSIGCTRESPCENPSVFPALSARLHYLCPRFR